MENDNTIEKKALRKSLTEKREGFPAETARREDEAIASQLALSEFYRNARSIFVYIGVEGEVDTERIIKTAFADGKTVCVPRTKKDRVMEAVPVSEDEFFLRARTEWPRSFGIPEPPPYLPSANASEPMLVIVPSLALDRFGYRLGYGGGYYDRFLSDARALKAPLVFAAVQRSAFILEKTLPRETYDMPVDVIVTENGIIIPVFCA